MDEWIDGWMEGKFGSRWKIGGELDRTRRGLNEDQIIEIIYS